MIAVGIVGKALALVYALRLGGDAVELVDGARGRPCHRTGAVEDLLGQPVASRIKCVDAAFSAVIAPSRQALGGVIGVAGDQSCRQ
ncbi:hypothetical protein FQZ97_1026370 [compost metagenome]